MRLPGSRLLHQLDLSARRLPLDELLRSCRDQGLTGFVELQFDGSAGMILYHLGTVVRAFYRRGALALHGQDALERLRTQVVAGGGAVSIRELPLDAAHLLRGVTNRRRLPTPLMSALDLTTLLHALEKAAHTGTVEVYGDSGAGLVLLVRGRVANTYWETSSGVTFEERAGRQELDKALERGWGQAFVGDFSAEVSKNRHQGSASLPSRFERRHEPGWLERLPRQETLLRDQVLSALFEELPSLVRASVIDLLTGAVLAQQGRGSAGPSAGPLAEKLPAITRYLRETLAGDDEIELLDFSMANCNVAVAVVAQAAEAIAVVADKATPAARIHAALGRSARNYAAWLPLLHGADDSSIH